MLAIEMLDIFSNSFYDLLEHFERLMRQRWFASIILQSPAGPVGWIVLQPHKSEKPIRTKSACGRYDPCVIGDKFVKKMILCRAETASSKVMCAFMLEPDSERNLTPFGV